MTPPLASPQDFYSFVFPNPFIFLSSILFVLAFVFPFVSCTSLAGDVPITGGGSGIHSKGKHSQGHSREGYLYDRGEVKKARLEGRDAKSLLESIFHLSAVCLWGFFLLTASLFEDELRLTTKKKGEERGREIETDRERDFHN